MKLKAAVCMALVSFIGFSAEEAKVKDLKVGTMVDLYYLYALDRGQEGSAIENRVYDRKTNDFTMNLFELNVSGSFQKVDFYADLDFGDFADQNNSEANDGDNHNIGQAYLSYKLSDELTLTAGKMYTHVGYEVAKSIENYNYSRSFAFTLAGPFWHEGVALNYENKNGLSGGLFIYDGWDNSNENNSEKTIGTQVGYSNEKFHFLFNYINGSEGADEGLKTTVYEFNTQYQLNDSVAVAFNGVVGTREEELAPLSGSSNVDKKWSSAVGYVHWKASDKWSFTPRLEVYKDESEDAGSGQYLFGADKAPTLNSLTFTATHNLSDESEVRFEYRQDDSNEKVWIDDKGDSTDSLQTISLSWLLSV
ncbi:MAG: outer membrane beta-barrel protein [Bacteriovoracaceae bacterium]|nr:outer membrane beta-barrel protein [Bacteriovoracaceae bacterium]